MEAEHLNKYYSYDDLFDYGRQLSKRYPSLLRFDVAGRSRDNRDIFTLEAGNGSKHVILSAGVHGRETINSVVLISMLEGYCRDRADKLEEYTIHTVPLVNPDGYMIALRGFNVIRSERLRLCVKAKGKPWYLWKENAEAVDINRNFPSASWVKKGPSDEPASEPETRALMRFFDDVPSIGYIDYHSRGKSIYYYRSRMSEAYNQVQYRLAGCLCMLTNYMLVPPQEEIASGDSGGNTVHYYSEKFSKPAFTLETVDEQCSFPLDPFCQGEACEEVQETPFIF